MRKFSFIFLAFTLVGCATPTPYQPISRLGKGYSDQRMTGNKYRVSFKGNPVTERATVETYLFYRSAEIALKEGFSHFRMINMNTDRKTHYESVSPMVYGYYNQDAQRFPYYIYGIQRTSNAGTMENTEYEAVAFVTFVKEKPTNNKDHYYSAKEVVENLKSKIIRPENK